MIRMDAIKFYVERFSVISKILFSKHYSDDNLQVPNPLLIHFSGFFFFCVVVTVFVCRECGGVDVKLCKNAMGEATTYVAVVSNRPVTFFFLSFFQFLIFVR